MEFEYDRSGLLRNSPTESYGHSPSNFKQNNHFRRSNRICKSPWFSNLILMAINGLIIISTSSLLIGRAQATKKCSESLYRVTITLEIYLCTIIFRYLILSVLLYCGLCDPDKKKKEYYRGNLQDFRRRFFTHVLLCLIDLIALTPISSWAANVLDSS